MSLYIIPKNPNSISIAHMNNHKQNTLIVYFCCSEIHKKPITEAS